MSQNCFVIVFAFKTVSKHRVEYFVNGRAAVYESFYDLLSVRIARKINRWMVSSGLVVLVLGKLDFSFILKILRCIDHNIEWNPYSTRKVKLTCHCQFQSILISISLISIALYFRNFKYAQSNLKWQKPCLYPINRYVLLFSPT